MAEGRSGPEAGDRHYALLYGILSNLPERTRIRNLDKQLLGLNEPLIFLNFRLSRTKNYSPVLNDALLVMVHGGDLSWTCPSFDYRVESGVKIMAKRYEGYITDEEKARLRDIAERLEIT